MGRFGLFPDRKPNIAEFLWPVEKAAPVSRKIALDPIMIATCLLLALFFFLFFSENRYSQLVWYEQLVLTYLWAFIFYISIYYFVGRPSYYLLCRNIPFAWGCFILFTIMAIIEASFSVFVVNPDRSMSDFFWHVFSTQMAFVPAIIICVMFLENRIRNAFGRAPHLVPIWLPLTEDVNVLQMQLPESVRGKVLKLQSANQYVEITTENGVHELRATLKSLLGSVPQSEGIHLHRSIWMHRDMIEDFGYENGNPRVIDIHGNTIPVSRSKSDLVKKVFSERV